MAKVLFPGGGGGKKNHSTRTTNAAEHHRPLCSEPLPEIPVSVIYQFPILCRRRFKPGTVSAELYRESSTLAQNQAAH